MSIIEPDTRTGATHCDTPDVTHGWDASAWSDPLTDLVDGTHPLPLLLRQAADALRERSSGPYAAAEPETAFDLGVADLLDASADEAVFAIACYRAASPTERSMWSVPSFAVGPTSSDEGFLRAKFGRQVTVAKAVLDMPEDSDR